MDPHLHPFSHKCHPLSDRTELSGYVHTPYLLYLLICKWVSQLLTPQRFSGYGISLASVLIWVVAASVDGV